MNIESKIGCPTIDYNSDNFPWDTYVTKKLVSDLAGTVADTQKRLPGSLIPRLKRVGDFLIYTRNKYGSAEVEWLFEQLGLNTDSSYYTKFVHVSLVAEELTEYFKGSEDKVSRTAVFAASAELRRDMKNGEANSLHCVQDCETRLKDWAALGAEVENHEGCSLMGGDFCGRPIKDRLRNISVWLERSGEFPVEAMLKLGELEKILGPVFFEKSHKRMAKIRHRKD